MKTKMNRKLIATMALSATLMLPTALMAKVSGVCGTCHTMHNSQDGVNMTGVAFGSSGAGTPGDPGDGSLLRYGCIGCHTGDNTAGDNIPYVLDTGGGVLAGGNFKWVQTTDNTGHNVVDIAGADGALTGNVPPGGSALGAQLDCAGTNGCHGVTGTTNNFESIAGGHHNSADTTTVTGYVPGDATNMGNTFRMLRNIRGIEAADWEKAPSASNHNQYFGVDDPSATEGTNPNTISALCARCHNSFHTTAGSSSPWVRHPTDFDMANASGSEYAAYNGATDATAAPYSWIAPVASTQMAAVLTTINVDSATADDTAIVTCISCHRAHGSANADLLRWNPVDGMTAHTGKGNQGCFICHTTKDDV